jgi:hypothetical protein
MAGANSTSMPDNAVLLAIKRILSKLVRLAITFGVTYPIFEDLLKRSYVEVSSSEFKLQGKEQTDSRITLLSGLARRDVRQIRATVHNDEPLTRSLETRVADRWTRPPFLDANGHRAPLPRLASVGGEHSFEALVQQVSTDIRASVLLDEWVTKGFARIDTGDKVVFLREHYFGRGAKVVDSAMNLAHLASDLIAGYTDIMNKVEPRRLRANFTFCEALTQESMDEVIMTAYKQMVQAGDEINRLGEERAQDDCGRPDARLRFTYGTFIYRADTEEDPPVMRS